MKLTTNLDKLTPEQEKLLESIESKLNINTLARRIIDEEKAWEQWCEDNSDRFHTVRYAGGWNTPPGTVFEEIEGPEEWESEDDMWETSEGEERLVEAEAVVDFIKKNIDIILDENEYDNWYENILPDLIDMDEIFSDCEDRDNVWELIEYIL